MKGGPANAQEAIGWESLVVTGWIPMEEELDPYLGAREGFMEEAAIIQVSNNYNNSDGYGFFLLDICLIQFSVLLITPWLLLLPSEVGIL